MMALLKTDLKRAFTEPTFILSAVFVTVLLFGSAGYFIAVGGAKDIYGSAQSFALPFAAPLLAAMPYSTMIMHERETGYGIMLRVKLRKEHYELERFAVCIISGAAALFIPQVIFFAVCAAAGNVGDTVSAAKELVLPLSFGAGYAAFSYGLTFVNRQRYIPAAVPQVLYLFCVYAFPHLGLERFYPPLDIAPAIYGETIAPERFVIPALLLLAGMALTVYGMLSEREKA